jgi:hypothetical protein
VSAGRRDAAALLLLAVLWAAPAALVGFEGDFPLNDDWAFARSARTLAETGRFERVPWMYALAYPHVAAGALVLALAPGEPDYEVLRVLSWLTGFAAVVGAFALARRLGAATGVAALAAATIAANPLLVNLSFTFMSDVQFTALCTWSLFFFAGASRSRRDLAIAVALALLAAACRQPGVALLLGFAAAALVVRLRSRGPRLAALGAVLAAALALAWLAPRLDPADPRAPFGATRFLQEVLFGPHAAYFLARHLSASVLDLGLYLSPLAVALVAPRGRLAAAALGSGALALAILAASGRPWPLGLNVVHAAGVGPLTLGEPELVPMPATLRWVATAVAALAGARLLVGFGAHLVAERRSLLQDRVRVALLGFVAITFLALALRAPFFDRYLLPLLAPLAALVAARPAAEGGRAARAGAWALVAALGGFGAAGTHDYLAWNRARWRLLDPLVAGGVSPERIDGGFEFGGRMIFGPAWRWRVDDEYVVSFGSERSGYTVAGAGEFRRLLPPRPERVFLLHRESGAAPPPAAATPR